MAFAVKSALTLHDQSMSGIHLRILRHQHQSSLLKLALESPAPGRDDTWVELGSVSTHSSLHLRTWLTECLQDEGAAVLGQDPWVFRTSTERIGQLADELAHLMSTPESRKELAVTLVQRAEQLKRGQAQPTPRLVGLLAFASYLEHPSAGVDVVTLFLKHSPESAEGLDFCERILLQEVPASEERCLLLAELYTLKGDRTGVLRSLWSYLELTPEDGASTEQVEQMAGVLSSCVPHDDLAQLFAHPRVKAYRAALRSAAEGGSLAGHLAHPLEHWARQHPYLLTGFAALMAALLLFPRFAVPVLGAFALAVGFGFFVKGLKPRRSK